MMNYKTGEGIVVSNNIINFTNFFPLSFQL
jgi:hypothetical protein